MEISSLQKARYTYAPKLPQMLRRLSVRIPFIIFLFKTSKDYPPLPSFTLGSDHLFHRPSEYRSMARHINPGTQ